MDKVGKWAALAFMGAALVCGGLSVKGYLAERDAGSSYKELQAEAEITKPQESRQGESTGQEPAEVVEEQEPVECPVDFAQIIEECPDCYAWIRIPDTNIDYPIVQSPSDNTFYLDHNSYGDYEYAGAIFTENLNAKDFTDPNTVIYGHNMKNGSMFQNLHLFEDRAFMEEHPTFEIYLPDKILTYQVFAAYNYDDRHLLRDVLKPVDVPRSHVLEVMVPEDKDDAPMQPVKEVVPFGRSSVTEIAKMEHQGVLLDSFVPVLDKRLIHFIHVFERTAAKTDDVGMPEVCVRREENILAGEFVEGCVFLVNCFHIHIRLNYCFRGISHSPKLFRILEGLE